MLIRWVQCDYDYDYDDDDDSDEGAVDDGVGELCQLGEHQLSQPNLLFSLGLFCVRMFWIWMIVETP